MNSQYQVNDKGYYGRFGGAYIPEMLFSNVEELRTNYLDIIEKEDFKKEFKMLLNVRSLQILANCENTIR